METATETKTDSIKWKTFTVFDSHVEKCLFRIWPGVIYGPITFNFTCGPIHRYANKFSHLLAGHVKIDKMKKKQKIQLPKQSNGNGK